MFQKQFIDSIWEYLKVDLFFKILNITWAMPIWVILAFRAGG